MYINDSIYSDHSFPCPNSSQMTPTHSNSCCFFLFLFRKQINRQTNKPAKKKKQNPNKNKKHKKHIYPTPTLPQNRKVDNDNIQTKRPVSQKNIQTKQHETKKKKSL